MGTEVSEKRIEKQAERDEVGAVRGDNSYKFFPLIYWYHESLDMSREGHYYFTKNARIFQIVTENLRHTQTEGRRILQNNLLIVFQNVKVMTGKDKGRLQETKEKYK